MRSEKRLGYACQISRAQAMWQQIVELQPTIEGILPASFESCVSIGSGCSLPVAELADLTFLAGGAKIARTCTPLEAITLGLTPKLACIVSANGDHRHTLDCFDSLQTRGVFTVIITLCSDSKLAQQARASRLRSCIIYPKVDLRSNDEGFIPVVPALMLAMLVRFLQRDPISLPDQTKNLFVAALEEADKECCSPSQPWSRNITIVCTRWAKPGARDLATRIAESGLVPPLIYDAWNFYHGAYMPVAFERTKLLLMSVGRESAQLDNVRTHTPDRYVLADICAPDDGFCGGLYCVISSMVLTQKITLSHGVDPANPAIPAWGDALYTDPRPV